jgi:hypothetical protein
MPRSYFNASTSVTWEDEENLREMTFDVEGHVLPYKPAVINADPNDCSPEEGGIDDIRVTLVEVTTYYDDGNEVSTLSALSVPNRTELEAEFERYIFSKAGAALLSRIEDDLQEDAGAREEGARDDAAMARAEAREERSREQY